MAFIEITAGVFLILFALRYLRKGFGCVVGGDLLDWLQGHTHTRARALAGGMVAGTVMPSSTAMALLSVQMSREGKVAWPQVFAVLLGAQVGITALIQVLTFNLGSYAPVFLVMGGALFLYGDAARPRGVGQVTLVFGFLLFGMNLISGAARAIAEDPALVDLFAALGALPVLLFAGAVLLTFVLQSSTASIAVGIGLATGGQVTPTMLFLWVLGANIGLCLTVLAAGWPGAESRRLGASVLLVKVPLAAAFLFLLPLVEAGGMGVPGDLARQAAWTHTFFNLSAALAVPFAVFVGHLVDVFLPAKEEEAAGKDRVALDPLLLQHPSLAVNAALREALRVFDQLHVLREALVAAVRAGTLSPHRLPSLASRAREVMEIRQGLVRFLDGLDDDSLDPGDARMKDALDDLMREIPVLLRTLERDLPEELQKFLAVGAPAREAAVPLICGAADRCARLMEAVARMLMQEKPELGGDVRELKRENSAWMIAAKRTHGQLPEAAWEIIDDFQQLNRRLGGVAYVYCREQPGAADL
ncbi:MAG: Na/Pi cotransporter family protein [Opitutales bacterium]|nr:Na/Pi cotransporter family protein [Opitutales bacterium]